MTSRGSDIEALRASFGSGAVVEHEALTVDDLTTSLVLRPESAEALARGLAVLSERELSVILMGGGSRLACSNQAARVDAMLCTSGLHEIRELDVDEGVVHAEAGVRLATLREAVAATGWEIPMDPPGEDATVGGSLASAATGPCFGHPRDVVLGLEVVQASGARTRCGGRVVKNVTGYDLAKLYVGSFGSLGVIEAAWLRLRPRPARTQVMTARLSPGEPQPARLLEAARRPATRAAARVDARLVAGLGEDPASDLLVMELAGEESAVEADRDWLREEFAARDGEAAVLQGLRALQGEDRPEGRLLGRGPRGLRMRVAALPTRIDAAAAELRAAGAASLSYPARGLIYAWFPLAAELEEAPVAAAFAAAERASRAGRGGFVLEAGPSWSRRGREVFGDLGPVLPILRALKERYDPGGVLNPGRCAGGL